MDNYYSDKTTIRDLCFDKDIGKYMLYLYYPKRYLNNEMDHTITQTAKYGLIGFNFLKRMALSGKRKSLFFRNWRLIMAVFSNAILAASRTCFCPKIILFLQICLKISNHFFLEKYLNWKQNSRYSTRKSLAAL